MKRKFILLLMLTFCAFAGCAYSAPSTGLVTGGLFDGATVIFHPAGGNIYTSLGVKNNGRTGQNVIHTWNISETSRFHLEKADDTNYYIYMYEGVEQTSRRTTVECVLDLEYNGLFDHGHGNEGNVVHIVEEGTDTTKRWQFYRQEDGTYQIRNYSTEKYWALQDSDPNKNGNKLVQKSSPMNWEVEFVDHPELHEYDTYSFKWKNSTVTPLNWMSNIPDTARITDLSIPGVHDSATCGVRDYGALARCQQLYIDALLRVGVRYFDIRLGMDKGRLVLRHGSDYCIFRDKTNLLTLDTVMDWINSFLDKSPSETIILQIKDDEGNDTTSRAAYNYFKNLAEVSNSRIYAGNTVPSLGNLRGKILILSRLSPKRLTEDMNYDISGLKWAMDTNDWNSGENNGYALTASFDSGDCEVWTQDHYLETADNKWPWVTGSIGQASTLYSNSRKANKHNWYIGYTSCTTLDSDVLDTVGRFADSGELTPLACARSINANLKTAPWMTDRRYVGAVCSDFMDGELAGLIFRKNFDDASPAMTSQEASYESNYEKTAETDYFEKFENGDDNEGTIKGYDDAPTANEANPISSSSGGCDAGLSAYVFAAAVFMLIRKSR